MFWNYFKTLKTRTIKIEENSEIMVQVYYKITLLLYLNKKCYPWLSMARMDKNYSLVCQVNVIRCQKRPQTDHALFFFLIESVDIFFFSRIPRMTKDVWEYLVVTSAQI